MDIPPARKAISLALSGNWQEAAEINQKILDSIPDDIDALNRLARCYAEVGDAKNAVATTNKVLKIDPTNPIAQKCLHKWRLVRSGESHTFSTPSAEAFLEESGKTKIVSLLNLGDKNVFTNLDSGDEVKLTCYSHKVSVVDAAEKYIGRLPDDLSARLRNFLKKGCKYQVLIKSISSNEVTVIIRELDNNTGVASFAPERIDYVSFTPPELVHHDTPETVGTEESIE
jgi:tetratricopeptide (TPR) repeat protein